LTFFLTSLQGMGHDEDGEGKATLWGLYREQFRKAIVPDLDYSGGTIWWVCTPDDQGRSLHPGLQLNL